MSFTVILDANGFSKGYGFVRFADEDEQKDALIQMNGFKGIGSKALRVSIAINRAGGQKTSNPLQGQAMAAVQAMWYVFPLIMFLILSFVKCNN